jgi:hypothetical protein
MLHWQVITKRLIKEFAWIKYLLALACILVIGIYAITLRERNITIIKHTISEDSLKKILGSNNHNLTLKTLNHKTTINGVVETQAQLLDIYVRLKNSGYLASVNLNVVVFNNVHDKLVQLLKDDKLESSVQILFDHDNRKIIVAGFVGSVESIGIIKQQLKMVYPSYIGQVSYNIFVAQNLINDVNVVANKFNFKNKIDVVYHLESQSILINGNLQDINVIDLTNDFNVIAHKYANYVKFNYNNVILKHHLIPSRSPHSFSAKKIISERTKAKILLRKTKLTKKLINQENTHKLLQPHAKTAIQNKLVNKKSAQDEVLEIINSELKVIETKN